MAVNIMGNSIKASQKVITYQKIDKGQRQLVVSMPAQSYLCSSIQVRHEDAC